MACSQIRDGDAPHADGWTSHPGGRRRPKFTPQPECSNDMRLAEMDVSVCMAAARSNSRAFFSLLRSGRSWFFLLVCLNKTRRLCYGRTSFATLAYTWTGKISAGYILITGNTPAHGGLCFLSSTYTRAAAVQIRARKSLHYNSVFYFAMWYFTFPWGTSFTNRSCQYVNIVFLTVK